METEQWEYRVAAGDFEIVSGSARIGWVKCEAHAKLISAAPEILGALETLVEHIEDYKRGKLWNLDYKGIQNAIDNTHAAIAKAKGRTTCKTH